MSSKQKAMPSGPHPTRYQGIRALSACIISLLIIPCAASAQEASVHPQLSPEQQSIAAISALTARGDNTAALQSALNNGLDNGLSVNEIKEVMVHLYAYSGFPRSLGGLNTFMAVMGEREARGIEDEVGEAASAQPDDGNAYARGEKVLATIGSGWSPTAPQSGYVAFAPVIEQFLREHLFGDIFGRDILSYSEREIVTISALASMDGVDPYLSSHMGIGMNVGLTEAQISGILSVVGTHVGEARAEAGREILSRVVASRPETQGGAPGGAQDDRNRAEANRSSVPTGATIFPRGARLAASDNFTGAVWVDMVVTEAETFDARVGNVTFEPGSRTDWHLHPGGQILLVTGGSGYHQVQGEPLHLIRKGDVVKVAPGVVHWHGALPDSELTHAAVATNDSAGETVWLEPVSDDEYYRTW